MEASNSTTSAATILTTGTNLVKSISSWKRHFVGSVKLDSFHFKQDVKNFYEKKTKKPFTDNMCTTLVVYINGNKIQFCNPRDNCRLLEFKFKGLGYDQEDFNISEDGLTFFSRERDVVIVATMRGKEGILPLNLANSVGYFNMITYSVSGAFTSPQIATSYFSKFCFNKSSEQFALAYNGFMDTFNGGVQHLTKNGKTQLSIHNTFTGSIKRLIEIDVPSVKQMTFSHCGTYIVLVAKSDVKFNFLIYNVHTGKLVKSARVEELVNVCPYGSSLSWSSDNNKLIVATSPSEEDKSATRSILYFNNIFSDGNEFSITKITLSNLDGSIDKINWNSTNESICFNSGKSFYLFNFETRVFQKKTIGDNLTDYTSNISYLTDDLLVFTRYIKETNSFKDKTYFSSMMPESPPDNEVPYIDILIV
jgi:hypothetical protein